MHNPPDRITGTAITLRLIGPDDAGFLFGLRRDPDLSRHLSPVAGTVEDQRRWIESYRERERAGTEAYYIVETLSGTRCGTIRLYGVGEHEFTWGSFILDGNKPAKAALEVTVRSLDLGFGHFGCDVAMIDVKHDNRRALEFYRRFGMETYDEDDDLVYLRYTKQAFEKRRDEYLEIVKDAGPGG